MNPDSPHQFVESTEEPEFIDITRFSINNERLMPMRACTVNGQPAMLWSGGIAEDDDENPLVWVLMRDGTGRAQAISHEAWEGPKAELETLIHALAKEDAAPLQLVPLGKIRLTPMVWNLPA